METAVTEVSEKVKEEVLKKLEIAEQNRLKQIQERLETLKKHVRKCSD